MNKQELIEFLQRDDVELTCPPSFLIEAPEETIIDYTPHRTVLVRSQPQRVELSFQTTTHLGEFMQVQGGEIKLRHGTGEDL